MFCKHKKANPSIHSRRSSTTTQRHTFTTRMHALKYFISEWNIVREIYEVEAVPCGGIRKIKTNIRQKVLSRRLLIAMVDVCIHISIYGDFMRRISHHLFALFFWEQIKHFTRFFFREWTTLLRNWGLI